MLKCCTIASGSKGNCTYIASNTTTLIVDMGVPITRLEKALQAFKTNPDQLSGVLITHTHSDHICGIASLAKKYNTKIYSHKNSAPKLLRQKIDKNNLLIFDNTDFFIGDITVSPFKVSHDVPCVGYSFYCGGLKVSVATDMGEFDKTVVDAMGESDLAVVESNYDRTLMEQSNYPFHLKQRIMGKLGHLSNIDCARLLVELAKKGTKNFILAHMSGENNYPELAFDCATTHLQQNGFIEGRDINIYIGTQDNISKVIDLY